MNKFNLQSKRYTVDILKVLLDQRKLRKNGKKADIIQSKFEILEINF